MFFYDIMYLYKAYEDYIENENKRAEEQKAEYQEQYDVSQMQKDAAVNYKMPDINNITKGLTNSIPHFNIPKL